MEVTREVVFNEMRKHTKPYWIISSMEDVPAIDCDERIRDVEKQILELDKELTRLASTNEKVRVKIKNKSKKEITKGGAGARETKPFTVILKQTEINADPMAITLTHEEIIAHKVAQALYEQQKEHDNEIMDLEDRIAELEKQINENGKKTGINGMIEQYVPTLLPLIISKLGGAPGSVAMAGTKVSVEDVSTEPAKPEDIQKAKCARAASKLLAVDPKAGDNLMMLAEYATLSPEAYRSFIPILEGQLSMLKK